MQIQMKERQLHFFVVYTLICLMFIIWTILAAYNGCNGADIYVGLALPVMIIWFLSFYKMYQLPKESELPYEGRKKVLVFILPLLLFGVNYVYVFMFIFFGPIPCKIMYVLVIMLLFYISIKYSIIIFAPVSMYCAVFIWPVLCLADSFYSSFLEMLSSIIFIGMSVFNLIEYIIMLYLNRRKWNRYFSGWKFTFLIVTILAVCNIFVNLYICRTYETPIFGVSGFIFNEMEDMYFLIPLGLLLVYFTVYCILINKDCYNKQGACYGTERRWVFFLPLLLLVLNILLYIIYYLLFENESEMEDFLLIKIGGLLIIFIVIGAFFGIGKRYNIRLWYPVSLLCSTYVLPAAAFLSGVLNINFKVACWISVISGIIEYGIMLFLNRKKLYISKEEK